MLNREILLWLSGPLLLRQARHVVARGRRWCARERAARHGEAAGTGGGQERGRERNVVEREEVRV